METAREGERERNREGPKSLVLVLSFTKTKKTHALKQEPKLNFTVYTTATKNVYQKKNSNRKYEELK